MSNGKKMLPYEIIMSAISGDAQSVNYVLEYYDPYINELCKRKIKLADGREYDQVDDFMKLRIRAKLIEKIVNFKILCNYSEPALLKDEIRVTCDRIFDCFVSIVSLFMCRAYVGHDF